MIAYIDSSVVLRFLLGQAGKLREWKAIRTGVTSALMEVECLRTLDRLRLRGEVDEGVLAARREKLYELLAARVEVVELTRPVLKRAAQRFPTTLGTLDAIHLATALLWRDVEGDELVMATHDQGLARAARACGLGVVGVAS